jgi:hypothetical protein
MIKVEIHTIVPCTVHVNKNGRYDLMGRRLPKELSHAYYFH